MWCDVCVCVYSVSRYDIKGCEVSRWTEPAPEGSMIIVVLKDLNFEGQYITLGKESQCDAYVFWDVALLHPLQASHYILFLQYFSHVSVLTFCYFNEAILNLIESNKH